MAARTVLTTDTIETFRTTFNSLSETDIGNLNSLSTTEKSSIVGAINELSTTSFSVFIVGDDSTLSTLTTGGELVIAGCNNISTTTADGRFSITLASSITGIDDITAGAVQILNNRIITTDSTNLLLQDIISVSNTGTITGISTANMSTANLSTSLILNSTTVTDILDEDNMASNSNTALITQQSIKAYVDTGSITLQNKTINSDSNTLTLDLSEGTLTGTTAEFNTALSDGSFATLAGNEALTTKTIDADNNTITNIGATEIKVDMITGQTQLADTMADSDEFVISDSGVLKRVARSNVRVSYGQIMIMGGLL